MYGVQHCYGVLSISQHSAVHVRKMSAKWKMTLVYLWMRAICTSEMCLQNGHVSHMAKKEVLLFKDMEDPACFTKTECDFTCFFKTSDSKPVDFIYQIDDDIGPKLCNMTVQRTEEGTFLHTCVFPDSDVLLFADIILRVVESNTNTTWYTRTVHVEDNVLLDPPVNVSLLPTGQAGQLTVAWLMEEKWQDRVHYGIRYSSSRLGEKTVQGKEYQNHTLKSLVPGDVVQVQLRVKHGSYREDTGHWSQWSHPAIARVPQSADDISLLCYTSFLENVTCQWNANAYEESVYTLLYKIGPSEVGDWRECIMGGNATDSCQVQGQKSWSTIWVQLSAGSGPLMRTFYNEPFTLNSSIKTLPPRHLKIQPEGGRLCLQWEAPIPALAAHLAYQVRYQARGDGPWMAVFLNGPDTEACLEVPAGSRCSIQVRAIPQGSTYSGYWSDWSQAVTVDMPTDIGVVLIPCISLMILVVAVVAFSLFPRYLSKLKQYLWPPVPNLDKVLQGFLTEISRQTWDPYFTAKQFYEETPASVVEVMSEERAAPCLDKPYEELTQLSRPERSSAGGERAGLSAVASLEVSPDYVILNTDNAVQRQNENMYVCKHGVTECTGLREEAFHKRCRCAITGSLSGFPSCSSTNILNQSYLPLTKSVDGLNCQASTEGSRYANLASTDNRHGEW